MRWFLSKIGYVIVGLAFAYMMLGTFALLVEREAWPVAFLKLVTGASLTCAAFGLITPYIWRPETFFIKRFRPKGKTTNMQLVARAFGGSGLWIGAWTAGFGLLMGMRLDVWLTMTLFGGLVGGTVIYIALRFFTYRKLLPNDSNDMAGRTETIFVRRQGGG